MAATSKTRSGPVWGDSFLLSYVKWETYESLLGDLDAAGSNIRVTYDGERLEFRAPDFVYEHRKALMTRMVHNLTFELHVPIYSGGSTTFRDRRRECGLDPDECFWITHEEAIRLRDDEELDRDIDPPADLVLEIENPCKIIDRLPLFAKLGFPEVWRVLSDSTILIGRLQSDGSYVWGDQSVEIPMISAKDLGRWLLKGQGACETTWIRAFSAWVREELGPKHRRPDPED